MILDEKFNYAFKFFKVTQNFQIKKFQHQMNLFAKNIKDFNNKCLKKIGNKLFKNMKKNIIFCKDYKQDYKGL